MDTIKQITSSSLKILDLAAAQGNYSLLLAEMGYDVTWNDLRSDLIDYVKLKYVKGKIDFIPGNVFELRLTSKFDVVLIAEVIEHVAHPDDFLAKVKTLVKPGGYVVMTTPNGGYFLNNLPKFSECSDPSVYEAVQFKPDSDGHIFILHKDELADLAKNAGLEIKKFRIYSNFLTSGHIKMGLVLKLIPRKLVELFERFTNSLPFIIANKLHTGMIVLFKRID